ncbi:beta-glucoside-specific PTS transporter subunit IIABC [Paenibacillus polysaccharolyticus]|uniref:beta-glucoside-specific PTS transporter subunit IIABC n=1 Tax=Paenibacillus polysaccharolyticus TaxID=582692 RepID=UPI0020A12FDA|nr:beta-glucoside-specific PTS transporter subunit IIABC [Paenibacillus polysaccharolyticus]MCP1133847.1 beta-glucoside-specific PTS transporter subunit IIABC [Paenibacillus polysaccharolyticus]
MNYKETAKAILDKVGGQENINDFLHCSTRLRMNLKDPNQAKTEEIKSMDGVMGAVYSGGQYQVIIGNDVSYVYNELKQMITINTDEKPEPNKKRDMSFKGLFESFAGLITGIFQPIIPAIAAAGMFKALLLLCTSLGILSKESQIYALLLNIADAAFYFLPVLLSYSSAQKFKTNPYIAATLAGVLLHPKMITLLGGEVPVEIAGVPVPNISYASSVLPIILTVWLMSYVEKFADKVSPGPVKIFLKPLIVILVMAPLALTVLGPIGNYLGVGLSDGLFWIQGKIGWLTVVILAVFLPFIVMFGMHKVFYPVIFAAMVSPGYETLIHSAMLSSNMAQGAGALAVWFLAKDKKLKQVALPAGISGLFGITEPALYGVHLRLKRTLVACMIGAGSAGLFAGIVNLKAYAAVGPGLASLPMFIGAENNFTYALITAAISIVVTPIAVYFIGFNDPGAEDHAQASSREVAQVETTSPAPKKEKLQSRLVVFSPLEGEAIPLKAVNDEAFSQEAMGKGMAIKPSKGQVVAPFDGTVQTVFRTKHSIGLKSVEGIELLIHVGIDTVKLKGQHFNVVVQEGDIVKHGQLLIDFDMEAIIKAGFDTTTPIIVTNSGDYLEILGHEQSEKIGPETPLITIL